MTYRFHITSIPHTATSSEFNACAYTQKVLKLCAMLKSHGHHVIHYGREDSVVDCSEHVTVTTIADWKKCYGDYDWHSEFFKFSVDDSMYQTYYKNCIAEITKRKKPRDFLLCQWGHGVRAVADAHKDLIIIEPGIGYSGGHFAPHKVFESYSLFHAYYGLKPVNEGGHIHNYDVVIPNFFDLSQFSYQEKKSDYMLCLGRINKGKGVDIAIDACGRLGQRLVIAGQGGPKDLDMAAWPSHVEYMGYADVEKRRELLANARGLIILSTYLEPFGGVSIEAMLSGTPVISSDWGCFPENNLHSMTGYRIRTFDHLTWAIKNIDSIKPAVCRDWAAKNFSMERVALQYEEYWRDVMDIYTNAGWYQIHNDRTEMDWLTRFYPGT